MENKLNESEDNKEEGEKGGKKEEVGDKRSPILGRQKKRFAKDDNKSHLETFHDTHGFNSFGTVKKALKMH